MKNGTIYYDIAKSNEEVKPKLAFVSHPFSIFIMNRKKLSFHCYYEQEHIYLFFLQHQKKEIFIARNN